MQLLLQDLAAKVQALESLRSSNVITFTNAEQTNIPVIQLYREVEPLKAVSCTFSNVLPPLQDVPK